MQPREDDCKEAMRRWELLASLFDERGERNVYEPSTE